jgi:hypothetical protein
MTDNGRQIPDDELIGAMHDGELSAADLARAERLLENDPARRRELQELGELSGRLQALPRKSLGDGFAAEVLRRAEREMLTTNRPAPVDEPTTTVGMPKRWLPQGRRPWLWAGAALAAGLLVMLFGPSASINVASNSLSERVSENEAVSASTPRDAAPATAVPASPAMSVPAMVAAPSPAAGAGAMPAQQLRDVGQSFKVAAVPQRSSQWREAEVAEQFESLGYATPVNRHLAQQAAVVETLNLDSDVDNSLLVVEVDVDRRQLDSDPFSQVLLANGIQCATLPQVQQANLSNNLQQSQLARRQAGLQRKSAVLADDTDLVYVVAAPYQLNGAIAQLQSGQNTYRRVVVHPQSNLRSADAKQERLMEQRDGISPRDAAAKDNVAREADSVRSKVAADQPAAGLSAAAAPVPEAAKKKDAPTDERTSGERQLASDKLAKNQEQARSRGWFGRLTLPPADAPVLNDFYYTQLPRGDAQRSKGESSVETPTRGTLAPSEPAAVAAAKSSPSGAKEAGENEKASADRSQSRAELKSNVALGLNGVNFGADANKSMASTDAPLQRVLFVFRVVDSPESTVTKSPAATAAPAATAPTSTPAPAKPAAPAAPPSPTPPKTPSEPKP